MFADFKVAIVSVIVIVLAVFCCVVTADFGSCLVDAAAIVVLKVFAFRVDEDVPVITFGKNAGKFMEQVPSYIVEIGSRFGRVDRQ